MSQQNPHQAPATETVTENEEFESLRQNIKKRNSNFTTLGSIKEISKKKLPELEDIQDVEEVESSLRKSPPKFASIHASNLSRDIISMNKLLKTGSDLNWSYGKGIISRNESIIRRPTPSNHRKYKKLTESESFYYLNSLKPTPAQTPVPPTYSLRSVSARLAFRALPNTIERSFFRPRSKIWSTSERLMSSIGRLKRATLWGLLVRMASRQAAILTGWRKRRGSMGWEPLGGWRISSQSFVLQRGCNGFQTKERANEKIRTFDSLWFYFNFIWAKSFQAGKQIHPDFMWILAFFNLWRYSTLLRECFWFNLNW